MSLLANNDAMYVGPNWRVTAIRSNGEATCIYDFPVIAFAVDRQSKRIAFLVKDDVEDDAAAKKSRRRKSGTKPPSHTLKLFGFDSNDCEVGSLLATTAVGPARRIQWGQSGSHLFLFDTTSGHVTILALAAASSGSSSPSSTPQLTIIAEDQALAPYFYQHGSNDDDEWCCLINDRQQMAYCWNLSKNVVVTQLTLSRRGLRVTDTVTAGSVIVSLYDDKSISFALWDRETNTFVKHQKLDGLFQEESADDEKFKKITPKLRAHGNKDSFLVGLTTSRDVLQFNISGGLSVLVGRLQIAPGASLIDATLDVANNAATLLVEFERFNFQNLSLPFTPCSVPLEVKGGKKDKKDKKKSPQEVDDVNEDEDAVGSNDNTNTTTGTESSAQKSTERVRVAEPIKPTTPTPSTTSNKPPTASTPATAASSPSTKPTIASTTASHNNAPVKNSSGVSPALIVGGLGLAVVVLVAVKVLRQSRN